MNHCICILILILSTTYHAYSQRQVSPDKYLIEFTDKNGNNFSLSEPGNFLSQRALERRMNQGIELGLKDLPVTQSYIDSITKTGVKVLYPLKWFNSLIIQTSDTSMFDRIRAFSFVKKSYQYSRYLKKTQKIVKDLDSPDPRYKSTPYSYGNSRKQIEIVKGNVLHNLGYRGKGMVIAILDAGFNNSNNISSLDSIFSEGRVLGTHDFVKSGQSFFNTYFHGNNVMSIIGANLPGQLMGTAPEASFWLCISEDVYAENLVEEYNWVAAAELVDSAGADVINTSLGYTQFDIPALDHTYADMNGKTTPISIGANIAASKGMLVVVSAGNEGNATWHYISAPADADSVLAIGAIDTSGDYAVFSSTGPSYDRRIKPDVVAVGQGTFEQDPDGTINSGNGTSYSAPIITGLAACLWQANPTATNMQVLRAIQQSSSQYDHPDSLKGYGIPNFELANHILQAILIKPLQSNSTFRVYPNPCSDYIWLQFFNIDQTLGLSINIFDLLGRLGFNENMDPSEITLDVKYVAAIQNLPSGVYIIQVINGKTTANQKFIKQ
jgi:serine protease AprX